MDRLDLLQTVILSRVLHLFYQYCHNLSFGPTFVGDHKMFKDFYEQLVDDYDKITEYTIAHIKQSEFETSKINQAISQKLQQFQVEKMSMTKMCKSSTALELEFYSSLVNLNNVGDIGLKNMVGDFAERSNVRQYKLRQRLK